MTRRVCALVLALLLLHAGAAGARPNPQKPPARVEIGHVVLGTDAAGRAEALVPVTYPIQLNGHKAPLDIAVTDGRGNRLRHRTIRVRLSAGALRSPERRTMVPLPACTEPVRWRVAKQPEHGDAQVVGESLVYRSDPEFRGTDSVTLAGGQQVRLAVGDRGEPVVRAIGDSVTAGFGYYSNGTPMTIGRLLGCRPPAREYDDACSSNSLVTTNTQKLIYAPDYGLANNISWAAQWANEHGIINYENLAVSGSEPADWAPGGALHKTTEGVEAEDPDYILMTIGANPLLSNMLFGLDNMGCAVESDIVGGYRECIEAAFAEAHLRESLKGLYEDLVAHTDATIYLMQNHLAVPSSAYSCSRLGYAMDGPSVQSTPTQKELAILPPLSFCRGPEGGGPPWVISGDTGIHPSAVGYEQMARLVPPPEG